MLSFLMTLTMRLPILALRLSAVALVSIAGWEGYKSVAYIPVPGDVPTIGFGTTKDVKMGDTIDPVTALQKKLRDVEVFEGAIKQCVHVPLSQHEYDAYLSLAYNIGSGAFCRSTLVRKLNAQDYEGACKEILRWDKFKGKPLQGLTNRRQAEYKQCMGI
jgi:lysozyme